MASFSRFRSSSVNTTMNREVSRDCEFNNLVSRWNSAPSTTSYGTPMYSLTSPLRKHSVYCLASRWRNDVFGDSSLAGLSAGATHRSGKCESSFPVSAARILQPTTGTLVSAPSAGRAARRLWLRRPALFALHPSPESASNAHADGHLPLRRRNKD